MKRPKPKDVVTEVECPACEGTGFPKVRQPVQPGRKIAASSLPDTTSQPRWAVFLEPLATRRDCPERYSGGGHGPMARHYGRETGSG
jgi:hypothetical protein